MYIWVGGEIVIESVERAGNTYTFHLDGNNKITIELNDLEKGKPILETIQKYVDPKKGVNISWI